MENEQKQHNARKMRCHLLHAAKDQGSHQGCPYVIELQGGI